MLILKLNKTFEVEGYDQLINIRKKFVKFKGPKYYIKKLY